MTAYRKSQLKLKDLQIESDALQIAISGTAWSAIGGNRQGFDLWDAMGKNAMFAALLSSANILLLAWLRWLFFATGPKPRLPGTVTDP